MRYALNILAAVAPAWLQAWVPATWFDRYSRRCEEYRLPAGKPERYALAAQMGTDGRAVLDYVFAPTTPPWIREVPAVQTLRQVWVQQFYASESDQPMQWRIAEDLPPAPRLICSPYDPEARWSKKRETEWTGYKVHLSESCDDDQPHLITNVETTLATTTDNAMTDVIQTHLAERGLTPSEHMVDSGYVIADHLVTSQAQGIDLVGPTAPEPGWQAKAKEGFAASCFVIDWAAEQATCPEGKTSVIWRPTTDQNDYPVIQIRFAHDDCVGCPVRAKCVSSSRPRALTIRGQPHYAALKAARERQRTEAFKVQYRARAGIEGTISQGTRISDLRRSRYIGLAKTRLLHLLIAAAMNFIRVAAWLAETPRAQTRRSAFARLAAGSA